MSETLQSKTEKNSFKRVMTHSLVVIPFIIAFSCAMLFFAVRLLTHEKQTAYDLLEDVKVGGATKRWQGAFELSKMLAHPGQIVENDAFIREMISAFRKSKQDDPRVRQYLALAMGRTGKSVFFEPLTEDLANEKQQNLSAVLYAIGMLKEARGAAVLDPFLDHPDARIRSIAVVAIGNIANPSSIGGLQKALGDAQPNVQWGAAVSLARMGNPAGKEVLSKMLDRKYLSAFPEVDPEEQNYLLLTAITAASLLKEPELDAKVLQLSKTDGNLKVRAAAMEKVK